MHVIVHTLWEVVVDDVLNSFNIKSSRSYISSYKNILIPFPEVANNILPLLLSLITVNGGCFAALVL